MWSPKGKISCFIFTSVTIRKSYASPCMFILYWCLKLEYHVIPFSEKEVSARLCMSTVELFTQVDVRSTKSLFLILEVVNGFSLFSFHAEFNVFANRIGSIYYVASKHWEKNGRSWFPMRFWNPTGLWIALFWRWICAIYDGSPNLQRIS